MKMSNSDDKMLDDLFALGREQRPVPSNNLMARIAADAAVANAKVPIVKLTPWGSIFDFIGGWPSIGGLAVAGVTGIWFGIAPPASVATFTAELIGTTITVDLLDDTSSYFAETTIDG